MDRPNVLFILPDQWRFSAFSHHTDPMVQTPHADRLAAEGIRFDRSYASNPICSPNRGTIMSGRYSHQHGVIRNSLQLPPDSGPWLGQVFTEAGYATHYLGKSHLDGTPTPGFIPPGWRRRGFTTMQGFNRGHRYDATQTFDDDGTLMDLHGFEPTLQAEHARQFMGAERDEPFFCFLSWGPPHMPYEPPEGYRHYLEPGVELQWRDNVPAEARANPKIRADLAGYYGLCEALDDELGALLAWLDESGLADNTIVVFTSDHGDLLGSQGKEAKSWPDEESLHVPLFVRWPNRIRAGQVSDAPISTVDLMPTLIGLCGLTVPDHCVGSDFSAGMTGQGPMPRRDVYAQGGFHWSTRPDWRALITDDNVKYVRYADGETHLYRLDDDPYEMVDLADDPAHADVRRRLDDELLRRAREVDDPFPDQPVAAEESYAVD